MRFTPRAETPIDPRQAEFLARFYASAEAKLASMTEATKPDAAKIVMPPQTPRDTQDILKEILDILRRVEQRLTPA
jgi:hypothetical protein